MTFGALGMALMFAACLIGVPVALRYAGYTWPRALYGGVLALGVCMAAVLWTMGAARYLGLPWLAPFVGWVGLATLVAFVWAALPFADHKRER